MSPLKLITVPRIELTASTLFCEVASMIKKELGSLKLKDFYWIDSMIVLGYIHNDVKRFKVFLSNRTR